jgi:hypothetical protein
VFTRARHWSLSWARCIHSTDPHTISPTSSLMFHEWSHPFEFSGQNFVWTFQPFYACHMSRPSHPPWNGNHCIRYWLHMSKCGVVTRWNKLNINASLGVANLPKGCTPPESPAISLPRAFPVLEMYPRPPQETNILMHVCVKDTILQHFFIHSYVRTRNSLNHYTRISDGSHTISVFPRCTATDSHYPPASLPALILWLHI